MNFYPRRHTGGDDLTLERIDAIDISTHAATRAATGCFDQTTMISKHFYPRRHTGGDGIHLEQLSVLRDFYPRRHTGGDLKANGAAVVPEDISTRAASRAATAKLYKYPSQIC